MNSKSECHVFPQQANCALQGMWYCGYIEFVPPSCFCDFVIVAILDVGKLLLRFGIEIILLQWFYLPPVQMLWLVFS